MIQAVNFDRSSVIGTPIVHAAVDTAVGRLGLDVKALAGRLASLPDQVQLEVTEKVAQELTPLQRGQLEASLDAKKTDQAAKQIPLGLDKLLSTDAVTMAEKSPSLVSQLRTLEESGWKVESGAAGGGSYADSSTKTITLDQDILSDPERAVRVLAHEVGHGLDSSIADQSTKAKFVADSLAMEGRATLNNYRVRDEIMAAGGDDIGIAGNATNHPSYAAVYAQYQKDGDAEAAAYAIGAIFGQGERTSTTQQPYADYYGGWYDKTHPDRPKQ